jgi:two-component sensor histidine kinase
MIESSRMPIVREIQQQTLSNSCLKVEADHRISNNLSILSSTIRMHARSVASNAALLTSAQVCGLLGDISARIEVIGKLHKLLGGNLEGDRIPLGEFLREICDTLRTLGSSNGLNLTLDAECSHAVEQQHALSIGLIAVELITNSIKYAHPAGLPVRVNVACRETGSGSFFVEVTDDGVGLPEGFDSSTDGGLGFKLMRMLAARLGAALAFDHDSLGLRSRLVLPVYSDA